MKDVLLVALVIGGAYLLLRDRDSSSSNSGISSSGDRTIDRVERAFNSGIRIGKEGKSLWDDIF